MSNEELKKTPDNNSVQEKKEGALSAEEVRGSMLDVVKNTYIKGEAINEELKKKAERIQGPGQQEVLNEVEGIKEELVATSLNFHEESQKITGGGESEGTKSAPEQSQDPLKEQPAQNENNAEEPTKAENVKEENAEKEFTQEDAKEAVEFVKGVMETIASGEISEGGEIATEEGKRLLEEYRKAEDKASFVENILKEHAAALDWENISTEQKKKILDAGCETIEAKAGEEAKSEKFDKDAFENMTASAKAQYIENLQLQEGFDKNKLEEEQKKIEKILGINEEMGEMDFQKQEKEFMKIIEEGQRLMEEGNPEKVNEYLNKMKGNIDNCSKRLKYIYLQMDMEPGSKEAMPEQYAALVASIKNLDEASEILNGLLIKVEELQKAGGGELTPEMKKGFSDLWKLLAALGGLMWTLFYISEKISEFADAHAKAIGIASNAGMKIGTMGAMGKLGLLPSVGVSANFAAYVVVYAGLIAALANEEKRDKFVAWFTGYNIPAICRAPAKKAAKPEGK